MDEEHTAGYTVPCAVCSAVNWGVSDEGRFYCRSCHNVIERTKEVVDPNFTPGSTRVSTISRGARTKRGALGRQWMVCEGFQFILMNQANALLRLGVRPHFKDGVLCQLWRIYLQKSRQAFTHTPVRSCRFRVRGPDTDSDSAAESTVAESDGDTQPTSTAGSNAESCSDWSARSGSADAGVYLTARQKRRGGLMSMKKTLSLIHLSLLWSGEALTLSDLLRLVNEGHVPYVNSYEDLPDEMKLEGKDALIFRVESVPSHQALHREAQALLRFLQLPAFPPISRQSPLHPALLSVRYLSDANLPDELHPWVCRLMERGGMDQADETPSARSVLPRHDLQAAALVVLAVKLLFGLDDRAEWDLSNRTADEDEAGDQFSLRRWFRLLQDALIRGQRQRERDVARRQWKCEKPLCMDRREECVFIKKRRIGEQVQICFEKLSSRPAGPEHGDPSSFRFCWGDQEGADGPSLHHQRLDRVLRLKHDVQTPLNASYWHPALRACRPVVCRSTHFSEVEASLPRSFVWLLTLFCFLLDVKEEHLYEEVLSVERRLIGTKTPRTRTRTRTRSTSKTRTRSTSKTRTRTRSTSKTRTKTKTKAQKKQKTK